MLCRFEAQEADDVAGIRVIGLPLVGLIDARGWVLLGISAEVADVAEHVTSGIL